MSLFMSPNFTNNAVTQFFLYIVYLYLLTLTIILLNSFRAECSDSFHIYTNPLL